MWFLKIIGEKIRGEIVKSKVRESESGKYLYVDAVIRVRGKSYKIIAAGATGLYNDARRGLELYPRPGRELDVNFKILYFLGVPIYRWVTCETDPDD